ncbi:MAG TPA: hypothetical protein PLY45_04095 [bacterium]|nr:hypothetical protein [bacterium]
MTPKLYKTMRSRHFEAVLKASSRAELEIALMAFVAFFEAEIKNARAKSGRLLRFNRQMRKRLEERPDGKA